MRALLRAMLRFIKKFIQGLNVKDSKALNACLVFCALLLSASTVMAEGKPAPEFNLEGIKENIKLSDYKGQVVYVDFWASWCKPCRDSFPWMNNMQSKYQDQGLSVVAVNLDREKSEAMGFLALNPANFTIAFDSSGKTPRQYKVVGMPSSFVINREGHIVYSQTGFNEIDVKEYEAHIRAALEKKSTPINE